MSQFSHRLIFREKDVLLRDSNGRQIKTFQKSDFLTSGGRYRVTESLLEKPLGTLLIEINVPIEVELAVKGQINANVKGATANANFPGATANSNEKGAIANAKVSGATANSNEKGAIANANDQWAIANANEPGAIAKANVDGAEAYAKVQGASIGYEID